MHYSIRGFGFVLFAAITALAATHGTPQVPYSFVGNSGQAASTVRFIGNGPESKAWFCDNEVVLQQGKAATRVHFVGAQPHPPIEAGDPMGATANYIEGADPSKWKTGLPMFSSIRYRDVWPGIEIHFRAEDSRARMEFAVSRGASERDVRLRFDGDREIRTGGGLVVRNASGKFRVENPVLLQETSSGWTRVEAEFHLFGDGTVGLIVAISPRVLFSGYFGGYSQSTITGVAVNSLYNIVVTGWTVGTDLPAAGGAYPNNAGGVDAFVAAFSPAGGSLLYCTYLGGYGDDRAFGVAVDASNNTYITGWTSSANFPVVNAVQSKLKGTRDAFVAKLNATGTALIYSTYLGGTGVETGNAIAVDSTNSAIIVGDTTSTNLPVTAGAFQTISGGGQDAFVAKLSPAGNSLTFATYLGGNSTENGAAVAVDAAGAVYIGGSTYSGNFPTLQASQPHSGGGQDGFVTRMAANGKSLIFSTYLGGSGGSPGAPEQVNAIAVLMTGVGSLVYVAGTTSSANFPVSANAFQSVYGGGQTDGFIARYNGALGTLSLASYFGGSSDDGISGMAVDILGYLFITGYTTSGDLPTLNPIQGANAGAMDAFVAKCTFTRLISSTYLGGSGNDSGNAIALDSYTNVVVAGSTSSGDFPVLSHFGSTGGMLSSFVTKFAPDFNLAVVASPVFYFDVWHDTGYNGAVNSSSFGNAGDIPVAGDWDGTGVKRIGIFRNGTWILDMNGNGVIDSGARTVVFGQAGDLPVLGDWNGTGRIKLGLFRSGTFILDLSGHLSGTPTGLSDLQFPFGRPGDIPVALDWNQSGTTKVGVFRGGQWLVDYSGTETVGRTYAFGQAGDVPVVGDWDSAGKSKIGVYRHGLWILDYNGDNAVTPGGTYELYLAFGGSGYTPLTY